MTLKTTPGNHTTTKEYYALQFKHNRVECDNLLHAIELYKKIQQTTNTPENDKADIVKVTETVITLQGVKT